MGRIELPRVPANYDIVISTQDHHTRYIRTFEGHARYSLLLISNTLYPCHHGWNDRI